MHKIPLKGGGFGYVATSAERKHSDVVKAMLPHVVVDEIDHPRRAGKRMRRVRLIVQASSLETKALIKTLTDQIKKLENRMEKLERKS